MNQRQQAKFDQLLEDAIGELPPRIAALLDEVPVVVIDRPTLAMVADLKRDGTLGPDDDGHDVCGLHTGVGITERSIEDPAGWGMGNGEGGPEQIHLFREGIVRLAGEDQLGLDEGVAPDDVWKHPQADEAIYEEIRITLLHEVGHHFGLDEDDLERLGYD